MATDLPDGIRTDFFGSDMRAMNTDPAEAIERTVSELATDRQTTEAVQAPIEWRVEWRENTNPGGCGQWVGQLKSHPTEQQARAHVDALRALEQAYTDHVRYPKLLTRRGEVAATDWMEVV